MAPSGWPVDGLFAGMRGDVDYRHFQFGLQGLGRGDAVHIALQTDIHKDQIERRGSGKVERFFSGARDSRHLIAQPLQPALDVGGDNAFVFNDQDLLVLFGGKLHGNKSVWEVECAEERESLRQFCGVARRAAVAGGWWLVAGG